MQVVKIQQQNIICDSTNGLNNQLQSGTVSSAWSRGGSGWDEEDEE